MENKTKQIWKYFLQQKKEEIVYALKESLPLLVIFGVFTSIIFLMWCAFEADFTIWNWEAYVLFTIGCIAIGSGIGLIIKIFISWIIDNWRMAKWKVEREMRLEKRK